MATNQLPGSFRGVPFGMTSHTLESGRRTVTHEFPGRDNPYTEDLGLKARSFSLEIYVLGDDASAQRDRLRAALEQKGPGKLVHPFLGTLTVQVTNFSVSESFDAGRLVRFSVGFIQPGKLEFPTSAVNPTGTIASKGVAATFQAATSAAAIQVTHPQAVAAMGTLATATAKAVQTSAQRAALPQSQPNVTRATAALQLMSSYVRDAEGLVNLIASGDLLSFATADLVFRLAGLGMSSLQGFQAYQRLLDAAADIFAAARYPSGSVGAILVANAALFRDAVLTSIVSSAAGVAVDADYGTHAQALAARDTLAGMFDTAMDQMTDDELFGLLQDLKASSLSAIPNPDLALPDVARVTVASPAPSLALAYDLMGGSADEQTLLDLNDIGNPWFMPPKARGKVLILR